MLLSKIMDFSCANQHHRGSLDLFFLIAKATLSSSCARGDLRGLGDQPGIPQLRVVVCRKSTATFNWSSSRFSGRALLSFPSGLTKHTWQGKVQEHANEHMCSHRVRYIVS